MDEKAGGFLIIFLFIFAITGLFFIGSDYIHPDRVLEFCKSAGLYQYKQHLITCEVVR